jgi:hypothetical protein
MAVLRIADIDRYALSQLLARFELDLRIVGNNTDIPASYWGECEAGLAGSTLFARLDTPVHSVLHEGAHYICMDTERRVGLNTDAGGDFDEEDAVCYLQILLSEWLRPMGRERMFADMDEWGYTFRLGNARAWFEQDAVVARDWLVRQGVIRQDGAITFALRY